MATVLRSPAADRTLPVARGFSLPVLMGPLRGYWWELQSGGKIARLMLGTYEREQTQIFQDLVQPGEQVLDIGAAIGYYTLLACRLVGSTGQVFSFEPDPQNLQFLRRHVEANGLVQAEVVPLAIGDETSTALFGGGTGTGTRRICDDGAIRVNVSRLDDLAADFDLQPQHVKIDVEGHEVAVLHGGERLFRKYRPTIFLSTHEELVPGIHQECCDLLREWGYQLQPIGGDCLETATEVLCRVMPRLPR